jgi:2-aminoadipate transaminase
MNWNESFAARTHLSRRSAVRELLKRTAQPGVISFAGGLPAPEYFPVDEIRTATRYLLEHRPSPALQYGETEGVGELRDWIAAHQSTAGLKLYRGNVVITTGAQQALELVGRTVINPGDRVLVENPTYLALLAAWRPLEAEFLGVSGDQDGLNPDDLSQVLRRPAKLLYTIPNYQNPQGTTLSLERRRRVLESSLQHGVVVVEDDPYGSLHYDSAPPPSLFALNAESCDGDSERLSTVHVGTFSKTVAPGLRVGYAVGSKSLIEKMVLVKQAMDLHTSTFNQHIVLELLRMGILEKHLQRLRPLYRERRDAMLAALGDEMPPEAVWTRPDGGMFLFVTLPRTVDTQSLLGRALAQNVAFVPGEDFHVGTQVRNTLRLNFSNSGPEQIREGIRRLAVEIRSELAGR